MTDIGNHQDKFTTCQEVGEAPLSLATSDWKCGEDLQNFQQLREELESVLESLLMKAACGTSRSSSRPGGRGSLAVRPGGT